MNIENSLIQQCANDQRHIDALYATIPFSRELLDAIRAGRSEFSNLLAGLGLLDKFGLSTSAVHDDREIEIHAFILGIVSVDRWREVETKSFLTYASHWIDDFFDGDLGNGNFDRLSADRHDVRKALANMGQIGMVGFAMADRARHPQGVFKGLHRMLYGGLVQRSVEQAARKQLVREYASVASQFVDPEIMGQIRQLQPEAYWSTNKTVLELLFAAEEELDYTQAELWNLVYAPAIYYQDADEERTHGELSFTLDEAPRLEEMVKMVRLGIRHLTQRYRPNDLNLQQLRFAEQALPNLPDLVACEYAAFWQRSRRA